MGCHGRRRRKHHRGLPQVRHGSGDISMTIRESKGILFLPLSHLPFVTMLFLAFFSPIHDAIPRGTKRREGGSIHWIGGHRPVVRTLWGPRWAAAWTNFQQGSPTLLRRPHTRGTVIETRIVRHPPTAEPRGGRGGTPLGEGGDGDGPCTMEGHHGFSE